MANPGGEGKTKGGGEGEKKKRREMKGENKKKKIKSESFFRIKAEYFAGRLEFFHGKKSREPASLAKAKKHFDRVGEISPKDKHFVEQYLLDIEKMNKESK